MFVLDWILHNPYSPFFPQPRRQWYASISIVSKKKENNFVELHVRMPPMEKETNSRAM